MKVPLIWFDGVKDGQKTDWQTELAEFVSTISDPLLITIITLVVILKDLSITFKEASLWFVLIMMIAIVPTLIYIFRGLRKGTIHDWFISERKERYKVLLVAICSVLLLNIILYGLNAPVLLQIFAQISLILVIILSLTTLFWKVSFHSSFYTFFCASMVAMFGVKYSWYFLLLPLVGWSRTKLKKHTWGQVIVGALISLLSTYFVFKLYSYTGL